jgi:hypothetical protein
MALFDEKKKAVLGKKSNLSFQHLLFRNLSKLRTAFVRGILPFYFHYFCQ